MVSVLLQQLSPEDKWALNSSNQVIGIQRAGAATGPIYFGSTSATSITGCTYDGSGNLTGFARGGVTYVVAYPDSTHATITGSDGSLVTITLDGSGRVVSVV